MLSHKDHILTGRVTFETVIRLLIRLGAQPRYPDRSDLLDLCETPHVLYRSWSMDYKQELGSPGPENG